MKLTVIILAAGKGTRMKSLDDNRSKVSYPILGAPIVEYVLNAVKAIKPDKIITIVGHGAETTKKIVGKDVITVLQKEQKGTGHAVLQANSLIKKGKDNYTLILCGDAPLVTPETLKELVEFHIKNHNDQTIVSAILDNPFGYGRIVRDKYNNLVKVVEQTDTTIEEAKIKEVNSGVVIFNNNELLNGLKKLSNNNKKGEYYLTELISIFLKNRDKVGVMILSDPHEMDGINDRYQLSCARKVLQTRINKNHMLNGVSITDLYSVHIGPYVKIEPDTIIEPNVVIVGNCKIGKSVYIGAGSYIDNSTIKNGAKIEPLSYIKNNKKIK